MIRNDNLTRNRLDRKEIVEVSGKKNTVEPVAVAVAVVVPVTAAADKGKKVESFWYKKKETGSMVCDLVRKALQQRRGKGWTLK